MKYTMLIYLDESALSDAEREQCYRESAQFAQELHSGGRHRLRVGRDLHGGGHVACARRSKIPSTPFGKSSTINTKIRPMKLIQFCVTLER